MATIVMESAKVIEAAEKVLAHIKAIRLEQDEAAIAHWMRSRTFLGFKLKIRTREQAIKALEDNDMFGWRSIYAWGTKSKAHALLKLAQHGDPVTLNEKDIEVLF